MSARQVLGIVFVVLGVVAAALRRTVEGSVLGSTGAVLLTL